MYGPYFLIFYGFVIFFSVIALAAAKNQVDKTDKLALPPVSPQIDPYEIAYLRGGINEVARSVVFSLMQKGFIEIKTNGKDSEIIRINNESFDSLTEIEKNALNWFHSSRKPVELFASYGLVETLERYGQMYQARLETQQMLTNDDLRNSYKPWKMTVYLIILGLCLYKLLAALANGNFNVIFLIIFGFVGILIASSVGKLPRLTKLGKQHLERLQLAFDSLKAKTAKSLSNQPAQTAQTTFAGVDPMLLSVGIFGGGILAGTAYHSYNQAFRTANAQTSTGGCGSACGSSCSSGDSGSSSGDGGSSCGGGCGGCGGGCS
ncbi:TIGR04222 domain-containing membrane protein [Biomphalaria pfeifferi]|uniref:TIGR04222 domain-containing membrane protein n=1 Tax=Biomphalaria pfeifferi TaxID=112525 RepID=A0AAD8AQD9_BIOPF|nr:TIGR04222 domain-containing membrane protein [Biomphalaria pfeifferi]